MLTVYRKNLKKYWVLGISFPIVIVIFIPFIGSLWPELSEQMASFQELLKSPIYRVMLGDLVDLSTWQGMYFMYIFMLLEWVMIFATIFIPARMIASEMDNNTLDVMLSYPVPRWQYALEKFSVYLTYNLLYPILILVTTFLTNELMVNMGWLLAEEAVDLTLVVYAGIGSWLLFFALGSLSYLCGMLFLESNKAMAFSGLIILGQYMMERFGGIVESINFLQDFSIFHYLNASAINHSGKLPIADVFIVASVGILATAGAIFVFQKRELA
ncbi:MAG: ABC transporter permease subunit [Candidatus Hodarchaeales archaeon]|jgi:ABC-type transport system involved in multi-copper enzyme maturation permease subunit